MKYMMFLLVTGSLLQAGIEKTEEGKLSFTHLGANYKEVTDEINETGKEIYDECTKALTMRLIVRTIKDQLESAEVSELRPLLNTSFVSLCMEEGRTQEIYSFLDKAVKLYQQREIDTTFTPEALFQFLVAHKQLKRFPTVKKLFGKEVVENCIRFGLVEQIPTLVTLGVRNYNKKKLKEDISEKEFFNLIRFELLALTSDKKDFRVRYQTEQTESE